MSNSNLYDKLSIDISRLHKNLIQTDYFIVSENLYLTGFLMKMNLREKLVDAGLIRGWFNEFNRYWVEILGGRPLKFHDFFFLYGEYRKKFQAVELKGLEKNQFLESWQLPETIFLLFSSVYKYAISPLSFYPFRNYIKNSSKILEYGCGIAPITYSYIKYTSGNDRKEFTIADIQTITYHFAKWRLANEKCVKPIDIFPLELPTLEGDYDIIFLMTVLEHLPDPLNTLKNLFNNLKQGGRIVFDFILSEGKGLDCKKAIEERTHIIQFFRNNFVLEKGEFSVNKSMSTTIVRKK